MGLLKTNLLPTGKLLWAISSFLLKNFPGIIPLSNELLRDSSLVADRFVRDEMVAGIAEAEDITSLYGTGNENAPSGIVTACADNKIEVGKELTAEVLYEMVGKLMSVKLTNPAFAWRIPGVLWAQIYGMQTAAGNYIFRDEMKDGKLCGYPFKIDNNIKVGDDLNGKTQIFFGDWKHFLIGTESTLQIAFPLMQVILMVASLFLPLRMT